LQRTLKETLKETLVLKNDLADFEDHAHQMIFMRRSTNVDAKSELTRNSLVEYKG
jgi:hypothetical protein